MIKTWGVALVFLITNLFSAQDNYIVDNSYVSEFPFLWQTNEVINQLKSDPVLKNAHWGFSLYDPLTGRELIAKDSYDNYIPASTTKLISSESALRLLGEDFTWKTEIATTGYVDADGILQGNLYVLWNGDPTLGLTSINAKGYSSLFSEAYQSMLDRGIKRVNGKIIYESVVFDSDKKLYPFDHRMVKFSNYYSLIPTQDEEITEEEKQYNEKITSSAADSQESIDNDELSIEDQIMADVIASIEINNQMNALQAVGKKNASLAPPPAFFSTKFRDYLKAKGIGVTGGLEQQTYLNLEPNQPRNILMYYESPQLKDVVYFVDKRSNNTYAEHLMRTVGIFIGKRDSKWSSTQTVMQRLADVGYFYNGLNYTDGSGLSYEHRVSPISQVKYLSMIMNQPYYQAFFDSLPIAGVDGTLKSSFQNSPHKGSLHAKTGTLRVSKALAGYVFLANGEQLCFSILVNNFAGSASSVKLRMEKILNTVY